MSTKESTKFSVNNTYIFSKFQCQVPLQINGVGISRFVQRAAHSFQVGDVTFQNVKELFLLPHKNASAPVPPNGKRQLEIRSRGVGAVLRGNNGINIEA